MLLFRRSRRGPASSLVTNRRAPSHRPRSSSRRHLSIITLASIIAFGCSGTPVEGASASETTSSSTESTADDVSTQASLPTTTLPPPACGNGTVDDGEECDDGNQTASDGCENNCTETVVSPTCGDGEVNGTDECDDGNQVNTDDCTNTCKTATCGDSIVQDGAEQCDDGNNDDTDDCIACVASFCGDGFVQADVELCDNGPDNDDAAYDGCTTQCQLGPRCGDMVVQDPQEQCDDGTPDGDDLCNACTESPRRYIFVTSQTFNGKFNGVNGADNRCGTAALDADIGALNADWVKWLSDDAGNVLVRMDTEYTGWYALPGDPAVPVAKGWAGLTSGTLMNAINKTENGTPVPAGEFAWSNTKASGGVLDATDHCANWSSNANGPLGLSAILM